MADEKTIADLQSHIRELEQEAADAKRVVNRLRSRAGQPPVYPDIANQDTGSIALLRPDQFYGNTMASAIREYLKMRRSANLGAATLAEIFAAICKGGLKFDTENEENRKRNMRISLTKNTSIFHKLPNGTFGLSEWYGDVKTDDASANGKPVKSKGKRGRPRGKKKKGHVEPPTTKATKESKEPRADAKTPTSMKDAIRSAVAAMDGEFTKQDIVTWIETNHPAMKAEQKKSSVNSMISGLKAELKIVTATAGTGKEPSTFKRED